MKSTKYVTALIFLFSSVLVFAVKSEKNSSKPARYVHEEDNKAGGKIDNGKPLHLHEQNNARGNVLLSSLSAFSFIAAI